MERTQGGRLRAQLLARRRYWPLAAGPIIHLALIFYPDGIDVNFTRIYLTRSESWSRCPNLPNHPSPPSSARASLRRGRSAKSRARSRRRWIKAPSRIVRDAKSRRRTVRPPLEGFA